MHNTIPLHRHQGNIASFYCLSAADFFLMLKTIVNWLRVFSGKVNNEKLKQNILQALPFWIASLATGLVAVFYAKMFAWAERLSVNIAKQGGWEIFLVTPVCFLFAVWVVRKFATNARGSGIPQVMASIELATPRHNHHVDKFLSIKTILVKMASSICLVMGGGAIGREGPTIQIAGSIFWKVNQLLPKSWPKTSKKNMIMTGAAAGLAAAFNTPLGGIVFAIEELAKTHINYFKTAILTAVLLAGLTAQGILGSYLYLGYPKVSGLSAYIFLFVVLVAALCGILGTYMGMAILRLFKWKASFKTMKAHLLYAGVVALIVATIAFFLGHGILGSGKEAMEHVLFSDEKYGGWMLPLMRFVGPVLSFSTGAAGGIFAPSLTAGAAVGSFISELFSLTGPNANLLILSGMVAFLTGITRSPFTSAILVLEMTDRHSVIFHLMLAGMIAGIFAGLIERQGFYGHLEHDYLREIYHEEELKREEELAREEMEDAVSSEKESHAV